MVREIVEAYILESTEGEWSMSGPGWGTESVVVFRPIELWFKFPIFFKYRAPNVQNMSNRLGDRYGYFNKYHFV